MEITLVIAPHSATLGFRILPFADLWSGIVAGQKTMNRHLYRFPMALLRQLLAITTVVCLICPVQANAASKIAILVGGSTKLIYLPAKLAEQLGYFRREGLEVEFQNQLAGVDAENELLAGAVQAVVGFYDHTIDLQSRGKDITSIVLLCQVPGEVVLVARHASGWIKSMKDIKGRTMGVTGLGASTNFLTQYLASRQGIASNQYSLVPVGADNTFIAAMKQGRIDAGMTTEPTVSQMLKTGEASILVDMRSADGTRKALTLQRVCMCRPIGCMRTGKRPASWPGQW